MAEDRPDVRAAIAIEPLIFDENHDTTDDEWLWLERIAREALGVLGYGS